MANTDPALSGAPAASVVVEGNLTGTNLGGYVVGNQLAAGGMGLVYEATHPEIGRRAAVKVLKPEVAQDEEWSKRFLTEARAIAALNHRNIVEILNFGRTPDGRQYMMMAFLEGESLEQYIARTAPMAPSVALGIVEQVLNGLAEAHKKGVVHRDMKPSNVYLLREHSGELLVKVLDFGLARQDPVALSELATAKREEGASLLAGTPEYIAPEQAEGKKVGPQADLYGLGIMLFEMLSGQLPFTDENVVKLLEKHLNEAPPALSSLVNNLPEGLEELVESLLQKDPAARPQSADEVRQTVQRLLKRMSQDATAVRTMMPMPASKAPTRKVPNAGPPEATETPVLKGTAARDTDLIPGRTDKALERAFPKASKTPYLVGGVLLLLLLVGVFALRGGSEAGGEVTPTPAPDTVPTQPPPELPPPALPPAVEAPPVAEAPVVEAAPKVEPPKADDEPAPLPREPVKPKKAETPKPVADKPVKAAEKPPEPALPAPPMVVLSPDEAKELDRCQRGMEDDYSRLDTEAWKLPEGAVRDAARSALSQLRRRAQDARSLESCRKAQADVGTWQEKYTP